MPRYFSPVMPQTELGRAVQNIGMAILSAMPRPGELEAAAAEAHYRDQLARRAQLESDLLERRAIGGRMLADRLRAVPPAGRELNAGELYRDAAAVAAEHGLDLGSIAKIVLGMAANLPGTSEEQIARAYIGADNAPFGVDQAFLPSAREEIAARKHRQAMALEAAQQAAMNARNAAMISAQDRRHAAQLDALRERQAIDIAADKERQELAIAALQSRLEQTLAAQKARQDAALAAEMEWRDRALAAAAERQDKSLIAQREKQDAALAAQREMKELALQAQDERLDKTLIAKRELQDAALAAQREMKEQALAAAGERQDKELFARREFQDAAQAFEREMKERALQALGERQDKALIARRELQDAALASQREMQERSLAAAAGRQREALDAASERQQAAIADREKRQERSLAAAKERMEMALKERAAVPMDISPIDVRRLEVGAFSTIPGATYVPATGGEMIVDPDLLALLDQARLAEARAIASDIYQRTRNAAQAQQALLSHLNILPGTRFEPAEDRWDFGTGLRDTPARLIPPAGAILPMPSQATSPAFMSPPLSPEAVLNPDVVEEALVSPELLGDVVPEQPSLTAMERMPWLPSAEPAPPPLPILPGTTVAPTPPPRPAAPAPQPAQRKVQVIPDAPRDPKQRIPGTTYATPKGPMVWTGTGWLPTT